MTETSQTYSDNDTVEEDTEEEEVVLRTCPECHSQHDEDDVHYWYDVYRSDHGEPICGDCYETNWFECENCQDIYHTDEAQYTNWGNVCDECLSSIFIYCEGCSEHQHQDDCGDDENYEYCNSCFEEHVPATVGIHDYGYTPHLRFYKDRNKDAKTNLIYLGVELEIEAPELSAREILGQQLAEHHDAKSGEPFFYGTYDASLDCGVELTSQPATLNYHRSKARWDFWLADLRRKGWKSHDTTTCGLHIHLNKGTEAASWGNDAHRQSKTIGEALTAKIAYFVHSQDELLQKLGRRPSVNYARYDKSKKLSKRLVSDCRETGEAISIRGRTLEFRFPKGTLKTETFYATLELIEAITLFCGIWSTGKLINTSRTRQRFLEFINVDKAQYINLRKFCIDRGVS